MWSWIVPNKSGINVGIIRDVNEPTAVYINTKIPGVSVRDILS